MNFNLTIWWIKDCLVVFPQRGELLIKLFNGEFNKIRRLLQQKRRIKVELMKDLMLLVRIVVAEPQLQKFYDEVKNCTRRVTVKAKPKM